MSIKPGHDGVGRHLLNIIVPCAVLFCLVHAVGIYVLEQSHLTLLLISCVTVCLYLSSNSTINNISNEIRNDKFVWFSLIVSRK